MRTDTSSTAHLEEGLWAYSAIPKDSSKQCSSALLTAPLRQSFHQAKGITVFRAQHNSVARGKNRARSTRDYAARKLWTSGVTKLPRQKNGGRFVRVTGGSGREVAVRRAGAFRQVRRRSFHHLEAHNAKGPDVHFGAIGLPGENFWHHPVCLCLLCSAVS